MIRLTTSDDAWLLPEIERAASSRFREFNDLAWLAGGAVLSVDEHQFFAQAGCSWVAVDSTDRAVGFLVAQFCPDALHIVELSVQPSCERQGLGRALISQAEAFARKHELPAITLTTFREVPWNGPFYARLGFVMVEGDSLPPRLRAILEDEVRSGLPADQRCAMTLALSRGRTFDK